MPIDAAGDNEAGPPPLSEENRTRLLEELLARYANQLAEHFSSVQIIATRLEPDCSTRRFDKGSGDFFARIGAARDWLKRAEDPTP